MAVTVRDVSGTPVLPVIEHFGGNTEEEADEGGEGAGSRRSRRAAGFSPAGGATASPEGGASRMQEEREDHPQHGRRQGRTVGRTFLDRSPPPECVEEVLHKGCAARKFSAVGACLVVLVRHRGQGMRV